MAFNADMGMVRRSANSGGICISHSVCKYRPSIMARNRYSTWQSCFKLFKIAKRTGLTIRQARTAINHLETTGEVTRSAYPKFTVFTLNNYDKFQEATSKTQGKRSNTDKQPDKQPTSNRQQNKKDKKNKKEEYISADAQQENDVRIFPPGGDF